MRFGLFSSLALVAFSLVVTLFPSAKAYAADAGCWNPENEPAIAELFLSKTNYKKAEDKKTIELIHDTIWSHRETIDPRLVYHRMVGESMGDPYASGGNGKYYGLFQYGGSHKAAVQALQRKNPGVSPRLLQVQYYYDKYVTAFVRDANNETGCKPGKKWASYTNLERSVYLNQGRCNANLLAHEREYCTSKSKNVNYRLRACKFSASVINGRAQRLCERQNPGVRPRQVPVPRRASAAKARS